MAKAIPFVLSNHKVYVYSVNYKQQYTLPPLKFLADDSRQNSY